MEAGYDVVAAKCREIVEHFRLKAIAWREIITTEPRVTIDAETKHIESVVWARDSSILNAKSQKADRMYAFHHEQNIEIKELIVKRQMKGGDLGPGSPHHKAL